MKRNGFSMIEVMVCLICILCLSAAIAPDFSAYSGIGKSTSTRIRIGTISTAIAQYRFEMGYYPTSLSVLKTKSGQYGPWISTQEAFQDEYGVAMKYAFNNGTNRFALWSYGTNKRNDSAVSGDGVPNAIQKDDIGFIGK